MSDSSRPDLFFNGRMVPYDDARVHVLTTAFKYAAAVFEGIRAYWNADRRQLYLFRVDEHLERMAVSTRISHIGLDYTLDELRDIIRDVCRHNRFEEDLHVRVLAYIGGDNGLLDATEPTGLVVAAMPQGRYPEKKQKPGLDVAVSSWQRLSDHAMPPRVKAIANYQNSRLALLQARRDGYDDAILLDQRGRLTEGPGYNIFLVRQDEILTPPVTSGILEGVTRDTLIRLFAERHGRQVIAREIDRTELYAADEAFFCGSSKEVTPILSVDGHPVGDGQVGPWARRIKEDYMEVARGQRVLNEAWLLPVYGD